MKKLFTILALMCAFTSMAQTGQMYNPSGNGGPDTATNAGTMYLGTRVTNPGTLVIQLNAKKVSGTVAGTASLQASIDADYNPSYWYAVPGTDTLTLSDGDNVKAWVLPATALHYRVRYTTSGTQKSTPKVYYMLRR